MVKIKFENDDQIGGMGGPFVSNLFINKVKIRNKYLSDHYVISENQNYYLFSTYLPNTKNIIKFKLFGFIPWRTNWFCFKILVYSVKENLFYLQNECQNYLFIESKKDESIFYYKAFHNGIDEYFSKISFNLVNFSKYTFEELSEKTNIT